MLISRLWNASIHTRVFLRRWMPTNILLDKIRTRRGLKWGLPAMLLGGVYLFAAVSCTILIGHGWSEWLYLAFFLFLWNALKFILMGPISVVLLARVRYQEARVRRHSKRAAVYWETVGSAEALVESRSQPNSRPSWPMPIPRNHNLNPE